jgi:hypothetical protein
MIVHSAPCSLEAAVNVGIANAYPRGGKDFWLAAGSPKQN